MMALIACGTGNEGIVAPPIKRAQVIRRASAVNEWNALILGRVDDQVGANRYFV